MTMSNRLLFPTSWLPWRVIPKRREGGNCSSRAIPLTQQKESVMDPVTIATLVISVTGGALQAAYWGTRLYRLYRIKKA